MNPFSFEFTNRMRDPALKDESEHTQIIRVIKPQAHDREKLIEKLEAEREPLTEEQLHLDREAQRRADALDSDIRAIRQGVTGLEGVSDARVGALRGQPGLDELLRELERHEQMREQAKARGAERWPRPFRYTGRPLKMHVDGRTLRPGDVMELTRAQADAWADRFKPVDSTGSEPPAPMQSQGRAAATRR